MNYRREIDGLRALAVMPVIFFHAGFERFSGGFIGVDVFFVISGYLITSIILIEKSNNTFSLINFYERRLRRILPALFCVMLACIPLAWKLLLPEDMKSFSQSIVATALYISNIFFWKTSGYFDTAAELKPLLHTWSLAIEEQYYLLFPIFLMTVWRFGIRWVLFLLAIVTFSSFFAIQCCSTNTAFYLLPTRCWELLVGAFVALYLTHSPSNLINNVFKEIGGGIGLCMIAYSVLVFDKQTPFPGIYTLMPTIGTALIILCSSEKTFIGKLLGRPILVSIGLVSYSAYLWHQPLFAFARIESSENLNQSLGMVLIVITFLLAYFSWKYVETPFRSKQKFSRQQVFIYSVIGSGFFILFGLIGFMSNGYSSLRFSNLELKKLSSFERSNLNVCNFKICDLSKAKVDDWLLIGDSNAYHFSVPLNEIINAKGKKLYNLAKGGCIPVGGFDRKDQLPEFNRDCEEHYKKVRNYVLNNNSPNNIVISAAWGYYIYGDNYPSVEGFDKFYNAQVYPTNNKKMNEDARVEHVLKALKDEVSLYSMAGKNILLIYPMPYLQSDIPHNRSKVYWNGHYKYHLFEKRNRTLLSMFDELEALPNVKTFKPDTIICANEYNRACVSELNGHSLYGDRTHLSDFGARTVFTSFFMNNVK